MRLLSHVPLLSVEWSRGVARVASQLEDVVTHFVLPDLPANAIPDLPRQEFYQLNTKAQKTKTIAVNNHTPESFANEIVRFFPPREKDDQLTTLTQKSVNTLLIVGGDRRHNSNNNNNDAFSTPHAIELAKTLLEDHAVDSEVWCVCNPNNTDDHIRLKAKRLAGADRVITQPLLSSIAWDFINDSSGHTELPPIIIGVALPKTVQGLLFWLELLEQPELEQDKVFQRHLQYFQQQQYNNNNDNVGLEWSRSQLSMLVDDELLDSSIDGLHFMPMKNTQTLLRLLDDVG